MPLVEMVDKIVFSWDGKLLLAIRRRQEPLIYSADWEVSKSPKWQAVNAASRVVAAVFWTPRYSAEGFRLGLFISCLIVLCVLRYVCVSVLSPHYVVCQPPSTSSVMPSLFYFSLFPSSSAIQLPLFELQSDGDTNATTMKGGCFLTDMQHVACGSEDLQVPLRLVTCIHASIHP